MLDMKYEKGNNGKTQRMAPTWKQVSGKITINLRTYFADYI